ncbi:MAG: hypothetical protein RLZZ420_2263 [Bacteroidota bacterium]|jgi:hypothetical protein
MKSGYLLAYSLKKWGWVLLIFGAALGLVVLNLDWEPDVFNLVVPVIIDNPVMADLVIFRMQEQNLLDEMLVGLVIVGSMMVAFSKEKVEDEYIAKIRLDSLAWAVYFNQGLLFLSLFFVYGMSFLWVMIFNLFTLTWFFIARFNWLKTKINKSRKDEE